MPQPNELWWSVVPGPSQLVEQLTAHLVRFESALIPYTTASFPWGEEFRLSVHDRVRQVHPNLTEELCDASTLGERSPGRWVLDVVGRGEIFCLPSDDPIEIAAESGLLKQRIFWVTHFTSKAQVAEWVAFAKALRKKAADHCCCVVLLLPTSLRINSHLPELETDAFFGEYDLSFFASFLLSHRKLGLRGRGAVRGAGLRWEGTAGGTGAAAHGPCHPQPPPRHLAGADPHRLLPHRGDQIRHRPAAPERYRSAAAHHG